MFAHVTMRATDLGRSVAFYRTVLAAIGATPTHERDELNAWDDFALLPGDDRRQATRHLHIGFVAASRAGVDAFWAAGRAAGYADDGAPGPRPVYGPDYYGSFLRDPDDNSAEAVHHDDVRPGGHIDHLWIGVHDLDASAAFYELVGRYTGLRAGSRSAQRRQFTGAWATFSLLADGRPATQGLHLAFVAPDRATVDAFHAAGVAAGHRSDGEPGERPRYGAGYYAAYLLDPDGTSVESVHRPAG